VIRTCGGKATLDGERNRPWSRVRFTTDASGAVTNTEVIERSGLSHEHRLLDKAAIDALSTCPVRIGLDENGKPVGAQIVASDEWK